jgi:hypothetical protein
MLEPATDLRLGRRLVLDELFDLSLYRALHRIAPAPQRAILDQLIPIETRHHAFCRSSSASICRVSTGAAGSSSG